MYPDCAYSNGNTIVQGPPDHPPISFEGFGAGTPFTTIGVHNELNRNPFIEDLLHIKFIAHTIFVIFPTISSTVSTYGYAVFIVIFAVGVTIAASSYNGNLTTVATYTEFVCKHARDE
ncbi:hypothetical protein HO133_003948 [Letharia lupina]|uniref:Uncharacterized protein n=1 Tax=Letharia lupina TaxID=560253 RepID=A0A8H6CA60_9LECA|nr:uncharacterized protein HO133_003948 [Letharia lupina]KAF6219481.1 hypothetical protein HO133_003948 [Letharia lupina]